MQVSSQPDGARPLPWGAFLVGLALGGFFDGILLHQVLQWHHFLSNVDAPALRVMRMQVLADGLFHVLMYFIAAIGLHQLWRGRKDCAQPGAGTLLWASALLGFCIWHFIDIVLAHWIVGIHRVRVDAPNPLAWDLGWLFLFGVVPLFFAWRMRRGGGTGGMWAVKMADAQRGRSLLYRHGALLVSNSPVALGCFSWTRTRTWAIQ